ncbi:MAG: 2-phospho-L-lactate transferase [Candidatus Bathyarchaeota archaeon]|jgi:LPPG:FO 2-phospho-L-lactate transferase|nr:2-phospho-L-lactate transferase [Candidatus Bathyarchaeota archaeon A05DMB-5]MDH7557589.1 2-phospho-L-lactate transferase [Candidatus Bathyarchaeota archaeon]
MGFVTALAGGVGAAKLLRGLIQIIPPQDLVIIGNTGDDTELYGLHISPDLDIIMYTLAGIIDETKGWGVSGDTFNCLDMLGKLGLETWFKLGDRDLAVHILRTKMLKEGMTLSRVTTELCKMLGVEAKLVPMSNDPVRTKVLSGMLRLEFQEYFVKRQTKDTVTGVLFEGADKAKPTPGIIKAISEAERVVICPSNPVLSISPILSVSPIRKELQKTNAYIVGISPIVGGKALKGPADKIMASMGLEASAYGVAKFYADFLDHFIIDKVDEGYKRRIEELDVKVTVTDTVMRTLEDSIRLAKIAMEVK